MGLSARTQFVVDRFAFPIGEQTHFLSSDRGGIWWMSIDQPSELAWYAVPVSELDRHYPNKSFIEVLSKRREQFEDAGLNPAYRFLIYTWLILPLTLLSAYLILWKPRKRA